MKLIFDKTKNIRQFETTSFIIQIKGMSLNQFQNACGLQYRGVPENSYKNSLIRSGNSRILFSK